MKSEALERGMNRLWLLWSALVATLVVYLVIAEWFVPTERPLASLATDNRAPLLLYIVAAVLFACAFGLRRILLRPAAPAIVRAADTHRTLTRYTTAVLLPSVLCESIAIMGLVMYLLGLDRGTAYSLILVAAAAMLVFRPRGEELERLLNRPH